MIQPLALVLYERLLPGSQLVNRLQDLKYRVQTVGDPESLIHAAQDAKPMVVLADLDAAKSNVCEAIARLKNNTSTKHLPVIAFGAESTPNVREAARSAGATLIVGEIAILNHLPQILEQALQLE